MKIWKIAYFIDGAKAYIVDRYGDLFPVETHIHGIIDLYELESGIKKSFKDNFHQELDWDKDWDTVKEYVYDFMLENHIFCVVVDIMDSQVYVRPNLGERPSQQQIKALSDWAIEHRYKEDIIVDVVTANNRINRINRKAQYKTIYNAWILPSGEVADVGILGHEAFVYKKHELFNITRDEILDEFSVGSSKIYELAYRSGAVRIVRGGKSLFVEGRRESIRNNIETIHKMFNQFGLNQVVCDIFGSSYSERISIEELYDI